MSVAAMGETIGKYVQLTKPTIILLVGVTGLSALAAEGYLFERPIESILVLVAILLSAGSANAINQYIDRDIDSVMPRTKSRRPIVTGQIPAVHGLIFAVTIGVLANAYLWVFANPTSAMISTATILFYTFIYTLWLKRRYYYNIVIGGAAGAAGPIIASAAMAGAPSEYSWILFWIIFMWTPAHFWALALALKREYAAVKIPMLPNVLGDRRTKIEIWIYTISLLPLSVAPYFLKLADETYLVGSLLLWIWYTQQTAKRLGGLNEKASPESETQHKRLFLVSIVYLLLLFILVALDGVVRHFVLS